MTLEALYAKTIFLLSQGLQGEEFAQWMNRSIAGEVNLPAIASLSCTFAQSTGAP